MKITLFNFLMRYLYNLITVEGVIQVGYSDAAKKKPFIAISGRRLTEGEQRELISDVKALLRIPGRETIMRAIRAEATEKLVNKSATIDDMVFAKSMLYTIDVEEQTLRRISNLSQ